MDEAMDKTPAELTMKPMLAVLIEQAVQLALVDVAMWRGDVRAGDLSTAPDEVTDDLERITFRHQIQGLRVQEVRKDRDVREQLERINAGRTMWAGAEVNDASELWQAAEDWGIELADLWGRAERPGWVEKVERRHEGYVTFQLDGDDRWWFHVPEDASLLCERYPTDAEREAWRNDVYLIPNSDFDPMALAQNVVIRLLGSGGWMLPTPNGDAYTGNMTARDVFEASMVRPDRDIGAEVSADLSSRGWQTGPIAPHRPLDEQRPDA